MMRRRVPQVVLKSLFAAGLCGCGLCQLGWGQQVGGQSLGGGHGEMAASSGRFAASPGAATTGAVPSEGVSPVAALPSEGVSPTAAGWIVRDPFSGRLYHQRLVTVTVPTVQWETKPVTQTVYTPKVVTFRSASC
jgi:hypothetical protein